MKIVSAVIALVTVIPIAAGLGGQNVRPEKVAAVRAELAKVQSGDCYGDAAWFHKGVEWALRYDKDLTPADQQLISRALQRCEDRTRLLKAGQTPWKGKKGKVARAYVSKVDGSVQPYGLIISQSYDPGKPTRLDVVLHGSTRPVGMSELRYVMTFDDGDEGSTGPTDRDYIELYPLGRVENCYRWAGETDVFEAIEDVCKCYNIDRTKIVLRGMSMGASGTWHLGLKHPDFFAALGPYCGYVDTHRFSETPGMNFVKVGPLPAYQEAGLHMLDSVDYAANAGVVPVVAAMGEKDPFFQAHVIMAEAMEREGRGDARKLVNLISPGTGHVIDPVTFKEQMRLIDNHVGSRDNSPSWVRFVTWTLKYPRCRWIEILGLDKHYERAEIVADTGPHTEGVRVRLTNISRFAVLPPISTFPVGGPVRVGMVGRGGYQEVRGLPEKGSQDGLVIERTNDGWRYAGPGSKFRTKDKQPGIQGPIDDAFTRKFLCVRGTGKPWNTAVQAWADANLKRLAYEWNRYFRGELPVKDDTQVTERDLMDCNLILFGDPGSNVWIQRALKKLPVKWSKQELQFGSERYSAADYSPAFIQPSPFADPAHPHYLVINSGHTFHEAELNRLNYLLFPRLGDWAVIKVGGSQPSDPSSPLNEEVLKAGFFDEGWKLPR